VQRPHIPPQPSSPQVLPAHWRAQHWDVLARQVPPPHDPHDPPQPSSPQALPVHCGMQGQRFAVQAPPPGHIPHDPPQPSSPHCFPLHVGAQTSQRAPLKPNAHWQTPLAQTPCAPQSMPSQLGVSELDPQAARRQAKREARIQRMAVHHGRHRIISRGQPRSDGVQPTPTGYYTLPKRTCAA